MINKVLIAAVFVVSLGACSNKPDPQVEPVEQIVVKEVEVKRPAPIVPKSDTLRLRPLEWKVINKNNATEKLEEGKAYFALDANGYENLSRNNNDVRTVIQQKNATIKAYENYFK